MSAGRAGLVNVPVVYHGSNRAFDNFEHRVSKRQDDGGHVFDVVSPCFFFAEERDSSLRYAKDRAKIDERLNKMAPGKVCVKAYRLKITKLLDFVISHEVQTRMFNDGYSPMYNPDAPSPYALEIVEHMIGDMPEDWNGVQALLDDDGFIERLKDDGYDGARLRENDGSITWAVFDADQISEVKRKAGARSSTGRRAST